MAKVKTRMFNNSWLRHREIGLRLPLGHTDRFSKKLYSSILPCTSWDHGENLRHAMHGGVFNLEFSPDGSLLVAACEKKSILMFDPLCRKLIHAVDNAHRDCVNCVRFLDSRVFATCSDDSTVALWDARNLKSHIRSLHGHSNWVKNIEFSPRDGLLVTSGFDGSIYTWDINSYTESGFVYNRVFHTNGLMRTRLNPDASKMIICTTGGYLIIIHNLDLKTMAQDFAGFKPNMYRLMQLSQTTIPVVADFTHLFSHQRKTNRVEFVTDFPVGDDAEVVSSLQIHPHGWCALSRNISNDENSEWTCVHDIQDRDGSESETDTNFETDHEADCSLPPPGEPDVDKQQRQNRRGHQRPYHHNAESDSDSESETGPSRQHSHMGSRGMASTAASSLVIGPNSRARIVRPMVELRMDSAPAVRAAAASAASSVMESGSPRAPRMVDEGIPLDTRRRGTVGDMGRRGLSPANVELHVSSADVWEALVAIREARVRRERERQRLERERAMSMRMRNLEQRFLEERRQSLVRIVVRRNTEGEGTAASTSSAASSQESEQQRETSSQADNSQETSATGSENSRVSSNTVAAEGATASGSSLSNALAAVISATNAAVARTGGRIISTSTTSSSGNEASGSESGNVIAQVSIGIRNTGRETREATSERRPSIRAVEMGVLDMIGDRFQMGMSARGAVNHTILVMDNQPERYGSSSGGSSSRVPAYHSTHSCLDIPRNHHIHQNVRRLTHFIEEPNVGKGFIKELCFSADGRLICSPFGYGVRLLAFSPDCEELSTCLPSKPPVQLYELTTNVCHSDIVVSTKFSPQHCLLVSGCLSGKIVWHQPVM